MRPITCGSCPLPAHDEPAGARRGLVALGPVVFCLGPYLGHLASALGMPERAREHFRQAAAVANRAEQGRDRRRAPGKGADLPIRR